MEWKAACCVSVWFLALALPFSNQKFASSLHRKQLDHAVTAMSTQQWVHFRDAVEWLEGFLPHPFMSVCSGQLLYFLLFWCYLRSYLQIAALSHSLKAQQQLFQCIASLPMPVFQVKSWSNPRHPNGQSNSDSLGGELLPQLPWAECLAPDPGRSSAGRSPEQNPQHPHQPCGDLQRLDQPDGVSERAEKVRLNYITKILFCIDVEKTKLQNTF